MAFDTFEYIFSNVALPLVSRVMFSASRIGTPLATSVPSVRVVRARIFFSMRLPKIGILMMNWSQPIRPCLNLRINLIVSQIVTGMPGIKYQYCTHQFEIFTSSSVIGGRSRLNYLEMSRNAGTILIMMNVKIPTATVTTTHG